MKKVALWCLVIVLMAVACQTRTVDEVNQASSLRHLVVLYTNDEHGWMEPVEEGGGAAEMVGLWREQEGYTEDGPFLILSGGDLWTGPAISSWFDGESMVEVMNAMNYDAAAIGNHEFDYGLDGLSERAAQAEFPFLSANIQKKGGNAVPAPIIPYVVQPVNGVKVGLIGLTTVSAPQTTNPENVASLDFVPYQEALQAIVPQVRADGADLLIVIGHICSFEMQALAPTAAELGITLIGGGHCHEQLNKVASGVTLIESGSYLQGYVRVDIEYDTARQAVSEIKAEWRPNVAAQPDPAIAEIIAGWRTLTDEALDQVIGYLREPIPHRSDALFNLVTDAWLAGYPSADVALTNRGGFRQAIPAGEITLATVVGVLPFDNVLLDVEITGAHLIENIECPGCGTVVGGMTTQGGYRLTDGTPIDPQATYHVLVTDFMYAGGDGFQFEEWDPAPYNTAIDWRQPVIEWISGLKTSAENPLDSFLDQTPRQ